MNNEVIVKPKTIKGRIDIDFDIHDIKKDIKEYLTYQHNINIINLISKRIYNSNWFECYNDHTSKSIDEDPLATCVATEFKFKQNLISNNRVLSNELYKTSTKLVPDEEYTNFKYIPIWHYNGNRNSKYTELFCHFEVLLHILTRKFSKLDNKIIRLGSIGLQRSFYEHQTLEELSNLTQREVINKFMNLKMENSDLNQKFDKLYELLIKQQENITEIKENNAKHMNELREQHKEQLKNTETKFNEMIDTINKQHERTRNTVTEQVNHLKGHITVGKLKRKEFINRIYIEKAKLNQTKIIVTVNRCMKENLPSLDVDRYKILLYTKSSSATESFNDFLEDNSHLYIHRLDSNKIEIETNKLDNFVNSFENYINNRDKNISTIIKELSNEPQITDKFDSLLEYEWLLNNTRYSRLYVDDSNNRLYYRR